MGGEILKKDQGLTFKLLEKPEGEEPPAEEGEAKVEKEAPVMCIQNVMVGPDAKKIHFFKGAQNGAFYATAIGYKALTNHENMGAALPAIEEIKKAAEEKQKEVDEKEAKLKEIDDDLKKLDEADNPPEEAKK